MLSRAFTRVTAVVLGVILVRMISEETLGTYRQVFLVYSLVAAIIAFRLESSLFYYVPIVDARKRRVLVFQTILVTCLTSAVMGAVLFFGSGIASGLLNNPELESLVRVLWLFPLVEGLSLLVPAYMISVERVVRAGVYSAASSVLRIAAVVTAFALGLGLTDVIRLSVVAVGAVAVAGCIEMLRFTPSGPLRLDRGLIAGQIRYMWPLWATMTVGMLNIRLDRFLISNAFDPATYAVYSCGAFEIPLPLLVTGSIATAMMPTLVALAHKNRVPEVLSIWQEAARKGGLVILPCFALLLPLSRELMVLLYRESYAMAAWPFAIYLCALPVHVVLYNSFLRAVGRTRPIAASAAIGLAINIVVSVFLVKIGRGSLLSFIGPSIGTVCAIVVAASYMIRSIGVTAGIPISRVMPWKDLGRVFAVSIVAGLVMRVVPLPDMVLPAALFVRVLVFSAVLALGVRFGGILREDEKKLLVAPVRALTRFLGWTGDENS